MSKVKKKQLLKTPKSVRAKGEKPKVSSRAPASKSSQGKVNGVIKKVPVKPSEIVRKEKPETVAVPHKMTAELLLIRARLTNMLSEVRKDIDHEVRGASERDLAHINDTSDMASDSAEGDLSLRIAESETAEAGEIERAIEKLDSGTYGLCESCNRVINADRLQFLPYSTLCIKCQELAEIRKREVGDELDDLAEGSESDSENN